MAFDALLTFNGAQLGGLTSGGAATTAGESQDRDHRNAIEISEFSFGAQNPTTIGSATTGAAAGKVKFQMLTVKKPVDSASPRLFTACAAGARYDTVTLALRRSGATGASADYLIYTFKLVFISGVGWSGSTGDDAPVEQVDMVYGAMQVSYAPQAPDGTLGTRQMVQWSQVTNTPTLNTGP